MSRLVLAGGAFKSSAQPPGARSHRLSSILPAARAAASAPDGAALCSRPPCGRDGPAQVLRAGRTGAAGSSRRLVAEHPRGLHPASCSLGSGLALELKSCLKLRDRHAFLLGLSWVREDRWPSEARPWDWACAPSASSPARPRLPPGCPVGEGGRGAAEGWGLVPSRGARTVRPDPAVGQAPVGSPSSLPAGSGILRHPCTIACLSRQLPWVRSVGGWVGSCLGLRPSGSWTSRVEELPSQSLRLQMVCGRGANPGRGAGQALISRHATWTHLQTLLSTDRQQHLPPRPQLSGPERTAPTQASCPGERSPRARGLRGGQPSTRGPSLRSPHPWCQHLWGQWAGPTG